MGEHKNNPTAQAAEEQKKTPTFEELIATPISQEEARKRLAEIDIQIAQCHKERAVIEQKIADIAWVRQVILRQALNAPVAAPQMGEPVGGAEEGK